MRTDLPRLTKETVVTGLNIPLPLHDTNGKLIGTAIATQDKDGDILFTASITDPEAIDHLKYGRDTGFSTALKASGVSVSGVAIAKL